MKKRIIAILLVVSVFCFSFHYSTKRTYAAVGGVVACAAACVAAVSMLQYVTSGQYERDANNLANFIEQAGKDANFIINGEIITDENGNTYHVNSALQDGYGCYARAFESIVEFTQDLFDKGELTVVDNNYVIPSGKLNKLIEKANQSISVMARPKVDFTAGYNCAFYNVDLSKPFALKSLPLILEFSSETIGQSIAPVFFDDSRIVFSEYYHTLRSGSPTEDLYRTFYLYKATSTYGSSAVASHCTFIGTHADFCDTRSIYFLNTSLSTTSVNYMVSGKPYQSDYTFENCFVYENGTVTYTPISNVDVSGMNSGILITTGKYGDFLRTIDDYSISTEDVPKLDDLSGVVPDDATLSIPINPDKDIPIENQVGVSVPGVGDFTLAELQGDLNLDINVPSGITTKFPFCIPFDFVRFPAVV